MVVVTKFDFLVTMGGYKSLNHFPSRQEARIRIIGLLMEMNLNGIMMDSIYHNKTEICRWPKLVLILCWQNILFVLSGCPVRQAATEGTASWPLRFLEKWATVANLSLIWALIVRNGTVASFSENYKGLEAVPAIGTQKKCLDSRG